MLLLKLLLVPTFLALLSVAGKRWGPSMAGWLAGLPVVTGPILFFLAMEHGPRFASTAASAALSAVLASVAFSVAYSRSAARLSWPASLFLALLAWAGAAMCLSTLAPSAALSLAISLLTLAAAPRLFPVAGIALNTRPLTAQELFCRMFAGAALTVAVTLVASTIGDRWSGLLSVFPILGIVLAVFSHRSQGSTFAATLLRAMAKGLYSFVAFCFTLSLALPRAGIPVAFAAAVAASLAVQVATKRRV